MAKAGGVFCRERMAAVTDDANKVRRVVVVAAWNGTDAGTGTTFGGDGGIHARAVTGGAWINRSAAVIRLWWIKVIMVMVSEFVSDQIQ
jgi:hypothetical protein